jgi:GTP-binding protein
MVEMEVKAEMLCWMLEVDPSLNTLAGLSQAWRPNAFGGSGAATTTTTASSWSSRIKSFKEENGLPGERQCKNGRFGKDCIIRVPPGTVVQEELEDSKHVDMGSLNDETDSLIVAKGGIGGEGTGVLLKSGRGVKRPRQGATGGERKRLLLTLKIVADVALVGVPNAGKSTLLAAVTRAKPKIANFPFTTVIPNLGVWVPGHGSEEGSGSDGLVLCDVPGLIAGAAQGVGLGHAFLRHVERCHVILHLIDATSNDPVADYEMLNREILRYGTGQLATMPQVVVVNKVDAFDDDNKSGEDWEQGLKIKIQRKELEAHLREVMPHTRLMRMSAKEGEGVDDLMGRLSAFVKKVKAAEEEKEA